MKNRKRLISILGVIILAVSFVIPAMAAENGIELKSTDSGDNYHQICPDTYSSQGNSVDIAPGITAVPKDDDGQGHLWTIYADSSVAEGTIITVYVQTQGNSWVSYELLIKGEGSFVFDHDTSLGRSFAFEVKAPDPVNPEPTDPEPTESTPCTCELAYDISKEAFLNEACTEPATEIESGTIVYYEVIVTVSINSTGCKAEDHTITLPERVTINDTRMDNGFTVVDVVPNEDGTVGTAKVVYSYKVTEFTDGEFTNTAIIDGMDDIYATATVTEKMASEDNGSGNKGDDNNGGGNNNGGNNNNASNSNSTQETEVASFEEEAPPLAAAPEEIFVDETPLAEAPVVEEIADFQEPAPPLSQMPQTGISDVIVIMITGFLMATALLSGSAIVLNKIKKNDVTR